MPTAEAAAVSSEDEGEDLAPGRAEEAQRADHRAPLDDAEHHGVVDEEHAHHEGEQAEGGEVQLEGVGELADGRGLLARRRDARALGEERRDAGERRPRTRSRSTRDRRSPRRKSRCAAPTSMSTTVSRARRLLGAGGVGDPRHLERLDPVLHLQAQRAAEREAVARGEGRADDGGLRVHEDAREAGLGERAAAEVVAEGRVRERVEAEDVQRLAVEVERRRVALDDRRARAQARLDADPPEDVLRQRPTARRAPGGWRARSPPRCCAGSRACALVFARSMAMTTATPSATPRTMRPVWSGPAHEVAQAGEEQRAGHAGLRRGSARAARRGRPRS